MDRRRALRVWAIATVAALGIVGVALPQFAAAQTTTTTGTATTSPTTTSPAPTSTAAATTSSPPATPATEPPAPTTQDTSSDDDIPWVPIAIAVVVALAIIGGLVAWSRRRGQRQQSTVDWRRRAASTASETGAAARLLAGGTPADATIEQQIRATLRTFEDLLASAPDDAARDSVQRALDSVRGLSIAIDADASARSAQPPFPPAQVAAAAAGLRSAASEADRTLRAAYNEFTDG